MIGVDVTQSVLLIFFSLFNYAKISIQKPPEKKKKMLKETENLSYKIPLFINKVWKEIEVEAKKLQTRDCSRFQFQVSLMFSRMIHSSENFDIQFICYCVPK